jgi:hypothetical protein
MPTPIDPTTPADKSRGLGETLYSNISPEAIAKVVLTLDAAASQMLHQFGQGQAMSDILRKSMAESVTDVRKLGGDIADVLKTQQEASLALGRNVILSNKTTEDLYATMKVTGQSVKEIVSNMADAGISSAKATNEMLKVVNVARESGVSAVAVSETVLKNMNALNKYNFEGGVAGLAKMAAQATSLRIDMSQTLGFAEKVFNPEGAIEIAAAMQRLGVSQSSLLDPLKLMDLSQNDPAELQNQIAEMSKQFVQLGKDGHFEIMPGAKRQLREISSAMGIGYDQLTKMALGSADLDKKMKEISFPSATEDQKKMIANMAEMGTGGEYMVKFTDKEGTSQEKAVSELNKDDVAALEKMANTAPKSMEELAKDQLSAIQDVTAAINSLGDRTGLGLATSNLSSQLLKGGRKIGEALGEVPGKNLSAKNIGKGADEIINDLSSGASLSDVLSKFKNKFINELHTAFENVNEQMAKLKDEVPLFKVINSISTGTPIGNTPTNSSIPKGNNTTNNSQTSNNPSNVNVTLTHNITVTAPVNIDGKTIVEAFKNNTDVSQAVAQSIKETFTNSNFGMNSGKNDKVGNPWS